MDGDSKYAESVTSHWREQDRKEELDKEVWRTLNSVHDMLCHREILNQTLRKGWMQLASARYEMGPTRISQSLFSLKPQAAKAVVNVTGGDDDCTGELSNQRNVVFELIKDAPEQGQREAGSSDENKSLSQLRRRPASTSAGWNLVQLEPAENEKDEDEITDYLGNESDSEDDQTPLEVQKNTLQGFGAMVVPNLRNSQSSFEKALQVVVDVLNSQSSATDAHAKVTGLRNGTESLVGKN